ncbi:MAG: hypothetical protein IPK23_01750 [Rhizobiales bacterium]|nr:hypothetical protein [Hyphomicrobiales bacterium]
MAIQLRPRIASNDDVRSKQTIGDLFFWLANLLTGRLLYFAKILFFAWVAAVKLEPAFPGMG